MSKKKFTKTIDELQLELQEQLLALRSSCKAYDDGSRWEAKRLAVSAYILCNDHGRNKSLAKELGIRGKLRLPSTMRLADQDQVKGGMFSPLVVIRMSAKSGVSNAEFYPVFGHVEDYQKVSFADWWDECIISSNETYRVTSRKNLIFSLRNQDGGGHVDPHLTDAEYYGLKREGDPYYRYSEAGELFGPAVELATGKKVRLPLGDNEKYIPNAPFALMRQIAWELDEAFRGLGY